MTSILITQCLQWDFVGPVSAHEPLPNKLHVGSSEAQRLLGTDPARGPVAQVIAWSRHHSLPTVHIRDWHQAQDPAQQTHLAAFGEHCVQNTEGARFVFGEADPHEKVVNAIGLNDFEGTNLAEVLSSFQGPLRVGVVGVWTEAKITFLLYDLKTRFGIDELATCSALTASRSRGQHFQALNQLEQILGVQVFDSVGEFTEWLGGSRSQEWTPPIARVKGVETLEPADQDLVSALYSDAARIEMSQLGGGFSGAAVFRTRAWDAWGHELAPAVAKIGPRKLIASERVAFERVEGILGNHAPRVHAFVDLGVRAGIRYAFASMGTGPVKTLKTLYSEPGSETQVEAVLTEVFDEILGRFSAAAQYESLPLLEAYGFKPEFAGSVRRNVARLVPDVEAPRLAFPGGVVVDNLVRFYTEFLMEAPVSPESHYVSYVHGDLNGANILVDARENVWMIDWFHTARGHVLKDLAKLENDLLYIFTPLSDESDLVEAIRLTQALRAVEDLRAELPETCPSGVPALIKAWSVLRLLRAKGAERVREDRDPHQLRVPLLRYAAHTLSFDESSELQKRWALAAACGWAEDITRTSLQNAKLRVDWLASEPALGMTICPGRRDRGRSLEADLQTLASEGVNTLVCLLPTQELEELGVVELPAKCAELGWKLLSLPIRDQSVPTPDEMARLLDGIERALVDGKVVVFCRGGLGRTGTVAASGLVRRGMSAAEAIAEVRRVRSPRAVETEAQEGFVYEMAQAPGVIPSDDYWG